MDMNAIITGIAGIVAGLSGAIAYAKRIEAKVMPLLHGASELFEHIKENHQAQQALEDVKQAFETESAVERDALIKAAAYCAVQALGVEVSQLNDIQKAAVAKYVSEVLPDRFKQDVTPQRIQDTLNLIQAELSAARSHDGVKAALAFTDWIVNAKASEDSAVQANTQAQTQQTPA
jgi:hypothetical protein